METVQWPSTRDLVNELGTHVMGHHTAIKVSHVEFTWHMSGLNNNIEYKCQSWKDTYNIKTCVQNCKTTKPCEVVSGCLSMW